MNEHVMDFYKKSADVGFALFLTATGLGQIVSAADLQCSPEGLKGLQRNVQIAKKAVPVDDSYAATRGLSKGREKQRLELLQNMIREYAQRCGYKL